jgi:dephospho-CoA kinase
MKSPQMIYNAPSMPSHNSQPRGSRLVIGVTGRIGAGKTSVGKFLATNHDFFYVRYSQVLSDWRVKDSGSKAHLQVVGWEVMGGGMQAELNSRLIAQIPAQGDCAVDGLRHSIDYESLTRAFPSHFCLLYVESPQETRWQRLRQRYPVFDDFQRADSHPVEQQIDSLRDTAFSILVNNGSLQELFSKVDGTLKAIQSGGQP